MRVLVIGVSTRAMVESAVRGGHDIVAVDFFGDRDQARLTKSYALQRDLGLPATAEGLAAAARRIDAEGVVYGANLENHPEVVGELAGRRRLLGNSPEVLRKVRDWRSLRSFCRDAGIPHPATLFRGEETWARGGGRWLRKRVCSGGGRGVRPWTGRPLDDRHLLQEQVDGRPASVAFVADGTECRVIGFSEQLVGRRWLGASGFAWCGNVLPFAPPPAEGHLLLAEVATMASRLTRRYGLRGLNGADLVVGRGPTGEPCAYLIEVNPRYSASMELAERAYGIDAYTLHLDALAGLLPQTSAAELQPSEYHGKGIVYARTSVTVPDTDAWYARGRRDVPYRGQRIAAGHPVCTVLATGADRGSCLAQLSLRAAAVYGETGSRREDGRERTPHLDHRSYA